MTYNSIEALTKIFPFWSRRQIERIVKKCEEKGLVQVANFNKIKMDRTMWYAVTETVKCIYANGEMETTKRGNPFTQTVGPIPDSKPDNNNPIVPKKIFEKITAYCADDEKLLKAFMDFAEMRKKIRSPISTERTVELLMNKLDNFSKCNNEIKIQILEESILNGWKSLYAPKGKAIQEKEKKVRRDEEWL